MFLKDCAGISGMLGIALPLEEGMSGTLGMFLKLFEGIWGILGMELPHEVGI